MSDEANVSLIWDVCWLQDPMGTNIPKFPWRTTQRRLSSWAGNCRVLVFHIKQKNVEKKQFGRKRYWLHYTFWFKIPRTAEWSNSLSPIPPISYRQTIIQFLKSNNRIWPNWKATESVKDAFSLDLLSGQQLGYTSTYRNINTASPYGFYKVKRSSEFNNMGVHQSSINFKN